LYEHKVYVQSVLWDINAFDQWGVELGKQLSQAIMDQMEETERNLDFDGSTNTLIQRFRSGTL